MYHQLCYRLILILVLLNLYCYASPIDQNQYRQATLLSKIIPEQPEMLEPTISNINDEILLQQVLDDWYHLTVLCAFYGRCNDDVNQQIIDYDQPKYKRLSSTSFQGIPKFGKRAFSSAFSGIPKFG